ncbi:MAG: CDP-alcohol phosphatidyltransferase family protein [Bacillota bacterium]|nr:CDP-alcohol phosphatidyltransferase family protein [Bacillota bacterium]
MNKQIFNIPNGITLLRMLGTLCLLFLRPLTPLFFGLYTLTGLTDALDGWLARKLGTAGGFGARLDSAADLTFYLVVLMKLFPILWETLPSGIWYAVGAILVLRLSCYFVAAVKFRTFASLHTYLNKLTGAAVFLLPYLLPSGYSTLYCWAVCAIAAAAACEELMIHLRVQAYHSDRKSILAKGQ